MRRHLLWKSLRYAGSFALLLLLNFLLPRCMPGDPLVHLLGIEDFVRFPEMVAEVRARYGLDQSQAMQFALYVRNLIAGDLGYSFHFGVPVADLVTRRLAWTLVLVVPALGIGGLLAGALGAVAGWHSGAPAERWLTFGVLSLHSVPQYGLAMLALFVVAFHLDAAPLSGLSTERGLIDVLRHALLPILVLGLSSAAHLYLIMRNSVADLRPRPFVTAARGRGLSSSALLWRHVLPNALLPFLALFALGLGFSVGGALMVEVVFSWPGMGTLILSAVDNRDYPLLQGCFLLITICVLAANWLNDILAGIIDPRLRRLTP
ncbi:MAG: ABC transporter permease [bacterium]|nr:ABC transporter permease [bacterium]